MELVSHQHLKDVGRSTFWNQQIKDILIFLTKNIPEANEHLPKILSLNNPYKKFHLWLFLLKIPPDIYKELIKNGIFNIPSLFSSCNIPSTLFSTRTPSSSSLILDLSPDLKTKLNFFTFSGNPIRFLDYMMIAKKSDLISPNLYDQLRAYMNYYPIHDPTKFFMTLDNPLTKGIKTNHNIGSYSEVSYPLGQPKPLNQTPAESNYLNYKYISCDKSSNNPRRNFCDQQVNDTLENIEDSHTEIDIDITKNANVYRLFLSPNHSAPHPSEIIMNEFFEIYGKSGTLFYAMFQKDPEFFYHIMFQRLRERAISLRKQKLTQQKVLSVKLEKALPPQRAKYLKGELSRDNVLRNISSPIYNFDVDEVPLLALLVEYYIDIANYDSSQNNQIHFKKNKVLNIINKLIHELSHVSIRKWQPYKNLNDQKNKSTEDQKEDLIPITFLHGSVLSCAAYILKYLTVMECTQREKNSALKIAIEIGITNDNNHGRFRLMKLIARSAFLRNWTQGAKEISGLYSHISVETAAKMLRVVNVFMKTINQMSIDDSAPAIINLNCDNGTFYLQDQEGSPIMIDLESTEEIFKDLKN